MRAFTLQGERLGGAGLSAGPPLIVPGGGTISGGTTDHRDGDLGYYAMRFPGTISLYG